MYGMHVHRAVLAAGATSSGATVHLVEGEYDSGPIMAQRAVPVLAHDTAEALAQRVQAAERELLISVLEDIARGRRTLPLRRLAKNQCDRAGR
jgi:phosphoribosylglycinamide formyltransferase-1